MHIAVEKNVPLGLKTTLKVGGNASHFVAVQTIEEVVEAYEYAKRESLPVCILGGGSNVVIPDKGIHALVIQPAFLEANATETETGVLVSAGAGITLDVFIERMVEENLWGIENLSGIPGTVGAVPIQNVGAYGVEAKDVVHEVTVYDPDERNVKTLSREACAFGYRDSFFKHAGKKCLVVNVTFLLRTVPTPKIDYKDLSAHFDGIPQPSLMEIRNAVLMIRSGKFPDWHRVGTAGSFFKNPIISVSEYERLLKQYPGVPGFPHEGKMKVPLGWILDKVLNVRGYKEGNVGLYEKQALVLVNHGGATAEEIVRFSDSIIQKIFDATSLTVEREVVLFA